MTAAFVGAPGARPEIVDRDEPDGEPLEVIAAPLNAAGLFAAADGIPDPEQYFPYVPGYPAVGRTPGALAISGLAGWLPLAWRVPVEQGDVVLVLGAAGAARSVALQAARLLGAARVVAAGRNAEALERATELGAAVAVCAQEHLCVPSRSLMSTRSVDKGSKRMRNRLIAPAALTATIVAAVLASTAPAAPSRSADTRLNLVAYSTPREAYGKIIPAFEKTAAGKDVSFSQSYGASGDQTRAVKAGLDADIVALSLAPDVDELVDAGLVDAKWKRQSYKGMVTNSVVVFVVRDGNPKKIFGWNDLLKPGVGVVTPNPFTSGGARWNVMAAYGAWRKAGKTDKQAQDNLLKLFRNVVAQDKSARDSLNTFNSGKGDVLLAYENEALLARKSGLSLQFRIPRSTILIENPIAVTRESDHKAEANAFLRYLRTAEAQRVFAENGYRPVNKAVAREFTSKFPARPGIFTIDQLGLGGWTKVQKRFFDPRSGILARIERQVGGVSG